MRQMSTKEIGAVTRLDGPRRFEYFVKRVADDEVLFGLWQDGWASMSTSSKEDVFPVWPAKEYAELLATGDWQSYEARALTLDWFLRDWLPKLTTSKSRVAVFPVPDRGGVIVSASELASAINAELEKYA